METELLTIVLSRLTASSITFCLVGEVALNFYNVARVINDIEVCVGKGQYEDAVAALNDEDLLVPATLEQSDIYSRHKWGWPRYRSAHSTLAACGVVVFPDSHMQLAPMDASLVLESRQIDKEALSVHFESLAANEQLRTIPVPRLAPFLRSLSRRYQLAGDVNAMMALEQLVDGMRLDVEWCHTNLSAQGDGVVRQMVSDLIADRALREDDFVDLDAAYAISSQGLDGLLELKPSGSDMTITAT